MNRFIRNHRTSFIVILLFFLFMVLSQWYRGAFQNECGAHPDEAAHYINGLMVHDYMTSWSFGSPIDYAENYYIHYPKVTLGHWPPVFYIIQALWGMLFSPTRTSILVAIALLASFIAFLVYRALRDDFGQAAGILAGILLLSLPSFQESASSIMGEIPLTLFIFGAALRYGHFLDSTRWRQIFAFSILAALAILTKGNGYLLATLPPVAVLIGRRPRLLLRRIFWAPAVIIVLISGPFYWLTRGMLEYSFHRQVPTFLTLYVIVKTFLNHLVGILGLGLSLVALIGLICEAIMPSFRKTITGKWASVAALVLSVWLFHSAVTTSLEARFIIPAAPAMVMLVTAGIASLARRLPFFHLSYQRKMVIGMILALLFTAGRTYRFPKPVWYGFSDVAEKLLSISDLEDSVVLISSDPRGQGMFIAEMAEREDRPAHIILRADKVLSTSDWHGREYRSYFNTPEKMMDYLRSIPVGVVIIDRSVPLTEQTPDQHLLKKTLQLYSSSWDPFGSFPVVREGIRYPDAIQIHRLAGHEDQPVSTILIDMQKTLGRFIKK
jgi:4-amino-4-deoxy-L-arabinose transferase-like glycosyltransferase